MKNGKSLTSTGPCKKIRPALSPEARENQLISLAVDLVERRLIEGTASSQETTHFLKLGSMTARLEKEILEKQKELIVAKTESLRSSEEIKEMYSKAMKAMRLYSGNGDDSDDNDDENQ